MIFVANFLECINEIFHGKRKVAKIFIKNGTTKYFSFEWYMSIFVNLKPVSL